MLLSRNKFFFLLLLVFTGPIIGYKIIWLSSATRASGKMWFEGHTLEPQGISTHPVILFEVDKHTFYFNGNVDIDLKPGEPVGVLYHKNDPGDAKIDLFIPLWGDTMAYILLPFFVIFVIAFTPEKLGPLIPGGAFVRIGTKPFIRIIDRWPVKDAAIEVFPQSLP